MTARVPSWVGATAEVRLDAVAHNWRVVRDRSAPATAAPVLKADAYGMGMEPVARTLWGAGARAFCVFSVDEGLRLRRILPGARVLVLGGLPRGAARLCVSRRLLPALSDLGQLEEWRGAARALGTRLPAAAHFDSGLNRYALTEADARRVADDPGRMLRGLVPDLWMSHLASAGIPSSTANRRQLASFRATLAALPPARASLANSCGIWLGRAFRLDLVRPGAALYGIEPRATPSRPLRFAVRIRARVGQVKTVPAGARVGYEETWTAPRATRIATLMMGYADGLATVLSNRGSVWHEGRRLPIRGRISMDLTTVDATRSPGIRPGDWTDILAPADPRADLERLAERTQQVNRDVLTGLGERVMRRHLGGAAVVS